MKKFLCILIMLLISSISANAVELKFVQVDSARYFPNSEENAAKFKSLIKEINKQKNISFVVFTGDNIITSNKKYLEAFLKKANGLSAPYYVALGHKDLNKKKGLSKEEYIKTVRKISHKSISSPNYTFTKKGVVFIVADGAKEFIPTPFGYYREDVINWVDSELTKNSKRNVIILQHFPVYPPVQKEPYMTYKGDEYLKMLSNHKNVKAVVSGFNMNNEIDVDGIKHITTAAYPSYRIIEIIDAETDNPTIWSTLK